MKRSLMVVVVSVALSVAAPVAAAPLFTFETLPNGGSLVGLEGVPIGWGYHIENPDPVNWLEITNVSTDPFSHGSVTTLFDFPILAPGQTVTVSWVAGTVGLLEFTLGPGAPFGTVNAGTFILGGNFWDDDPFMPGAMLVQAATPQSASYSLVNVAVPEPGAAVLIFVGMALLARRLRARH